MMIIIVPYNIIYYYTSTQSGLTTARMHMTPKHSRLHGPAKSTYLHCVPKKVTLNFKSL